MSKIKISELAKKVGLSNNEVITKLSTAGIEVKGPTSTLEGDDFLKACLIFKDVAVNDNAKSANKKEQDVHIIRRKVRVIKTDIDGNQVEQITTKAHGEIKQQVITQQTPAKKVIPEDKDKNIENKNNSNNQRNMNNSRSNRMLNKRNVNVVVTKRGKPVEPPVEEVKKATIAPRAEKTVNRNNQQEPQKVERTSTTNNRGSYNNNRANNNYNNGSYNNNRNNSNNNNNGNNNYNRPQNKNSFSNNSGNNNFQNKKPNFNKPREDKVEIPKATELVKPSTFSVKSKEKEKGKYDNTSTISNQRKDKNKMKEQQSRVNTNKLKGIEIGGENKLLDLYVRDSDFARRGNRKRRDKQNNRREMQATKIIPLTDIEVPEIMSVAELAATMKKTSGEVIKKLFNLGIMATVNQDIDFDTTYLVASEFGINATKKVNVTEEDILFDESEDKEENLTPRPPIVVVMGHVDHGKTSLLDAIKKTNVVSGEAGGITQHIGAYKVSAKGREMTFLDTPGHEAFTAMRARGAQVTDIAILIVAADDGIMPQTVEAINHAKDANVEIIVAINKIDKPTANIDKVKQELMEYGLVAEEYGGTTICCPISAKTGEGIDNLLDMVLLAADMMNLKSDPNKQSKGTILEARLDKSKGVIVSVLVQRGTLNIGDTIVVGEVIGKIRAMANDKGVRVEEAGPSTPVEILGLSTVPEVGDTFYEVENEKVAKHLIEKRKARARQELIKKTSKITLDDLFSQIKEGEVQELKIIIKADVQGSLQALKQSLEKLSNEEVRINVIHSAVGNIVESDVTLASVSGAILIGFNIKPDNDAKNMMDRENIDVRIYRVIYDAINDMERAMKGMLAPEYKEVMNGTAEVRAVFKLSTAGIVAGSYITDGKVVRNSKVRLFRNKEIVYEGEIESIKREKDDAKEVAAGYECGIKLRDFTEIKEGDIIESYNLVEVER